MVFYDGVPQGSLTLLKCLNELLLLTRNNIYHFADDLERFPLRYLDYSAFVPLSCLFSQQIFYAPESSTMNVIHLLYIVADLQGES